MTMELGINSDLLLFFVLLKYVTIELKTFLGGKNKKNLFYEMWQWNIHSMNHSFTNMLLKNESAQDLAYLPRISL